MSPPRRAAMLWAGPALMLAGLALAGWGLRSAGLLDRVQHAGDHGLAAFLALAAAACALGVPRQVVAYAAGLAYGFWPGLGLAMVAEIAACAADFWWARLLGRRAAAAYLARRDSGRLARLDRFLRRNGFRATLTVRLLPLGNNLALNLLAGVTGVAAGPFLLASAIGYVPQTVVFALLGGGVRVSEGVQIGLAALLLLASVALGVLLLRRRPLPA